MPKNNDKDNRGETREGPPCYVCKATTHLSHTRIADPKTSNRYDLYECTAGGNQSWSPVIFKK